jgi:hypothetical protein
VNDKKMFVPALLATFLTPVIGLVWVNYSPDTVWVVGIPLGLILGGALIRAVWEQITR